MRRSLSCSIVYLIPRKKLMTARTRRPGLITRERGAGASGMTAVEEDQGTLVSYFLGYVVRAKII